ncbi:MAG: signal peptidase I [Alphaproteobacteria bacterium]|nr:signal peptidase I [Alphaproteobacteria bacterium]
MYYLLFAVFLLIVAHEAFSYYRTRASSSDGWPSDTLPPFEITKLVVSAFVLAALVRTLVLEPFNIPSGSMMPNLLVGDYLFVSKYSYGYGRYSFPVEVPLKDRIGGHAPRQGDVIVFRGHDGKTDYIKRVIGVAGDRIQMKQGRLYWNDQLVAREKAGYHQDPDGLIRLGEPLQLFIETLPNGVQHQIAEIDDDHPLDNTAEVTVPANHIFVMGDNRDDSRDSRDLSVGAIPLTAVIGRAQMMFFSISPLASWWQPWEWPWAIRFNRFFQSVH